MIPFRKTHFATNQLGTPALKHSLNDTIIYKMIIMLYGEDLKRAIKTINSAGKMY